MEDIKKFTLGENPIYLGQRVPLLEYQDITAYPNIRDIKLEPAKEKMKKPFFTISFTQVLNTVITATLTAVITNIFTAVPARPVHRPKEPIEKKVTSTNLVTYIAQNPYNDKSAFAATLPEGTSFKGSWITTNENGEKVITQAVYQNQSTRVNTLN